MSDKIDSDAIQRMRDLMARGHEVLAYDGLHSVIEGAVEFPGGAFPQFARGGEGCRIFDSNGQAFVDWFMGWGPMILGYRHPEVEAAVARQLRTGSHLSLMHPLEIEVAEKLTKMIPCAEKVAFGKNGSDATCAAVRVARAFTGREGILSCGYHGFHDWFQVLNPKCRGLPSALKDVVTSFPYNDLDAIENLLNRHGDLVAAVIIDPVQDALPEPGYLEGLRDRVHRAGALLIFDEVVTGFRLAPGGAQELYGVVPDLACLGKALTNGFPLSAVVGKAECMAVLPEVSFGVTYRGETLSLAAAKACLSVYEREPVAQNIAKNGEAVRQAFSRACEKAGLPWTLSGHPSRMKIRTRGGGRISADGARALFLQECLKGGVLVRDIMLGCNALDPEGLETTVNALDRAVKTVAQALDDGKLESYLHFPVLPHYLSDTEL